jgi:predicted AAA+ superfamily ATPase
VPQHPAIAERHHAIALFEERDRLGPCSRRLLLQELRRQASWHPDLVDFFHYQDRNDFEVDIVLERSVAAGRQDCDRTVIRQAQTSKNIEVYGRTPSDRFEG